MKSVVDEMLQRADYISSMRVPALLVVVAGIGKVMFVAFSIALLATGAAYGAALWIVMTTPTHSLTRPALAAATILFFVCSAIGSNHPVLIVAPLIPAIAIVESMAAAAVFWVVMLVGVTIIGQQSGDVLSGTLEVTLSLAGAGLFLIEFARVVLRERTESVVLAAQAARIAELSLVVERHRIAHAIHDGVGHYLSSAVMQLEAARLTRSSDAGRADECVARARDLVVDGLQEVRRAVAAMREDSAPDSLNTAIAELLVASNEAGVATTLQRHGIERRLAPDAAWALFSTMQESLTNVRKHSNASTVNLSLQYLEHHVELEVADNGVGADVYPDGTGMHGIRQRALQFGGAVTITTSPGTGFSVQFRIAA